jgi:hypothetical protein
MRNLQGACYDDLIALNADEGTGGPITHIDVDGVYCEDCHSAARLLTVKFPVEHIHITNVHGTFYQYCIGITKYYKGESEGYYDGITLDNIYAALQTDTGNQVGTFRSRNLMVYNTLKKYISK